MFALLKVAQTHCSWIADFIKDSIPPPDMDNDSKI